MKIELKNIKHSPSLSEETEAFTADLYINSRHVGYAKNQGSGGSTDYSAKDQAGKQLILEAERYCTELPHRQSTFDPKTYFPVTLEDVIDDFLYDHLTEKEKQKFNKKKEKAMLNGLVIGKAEEFSFATLSYKIPITTLLAMPGGAENLTNTIKTTIPKLTGGAMILNTNIPEAILKNAGLQRSQYIKPTTEVKKSISAEKRKGRKL